MSQTKSQIRLRPATIQDLEVLKRWDEQEHVIASDPNDDWNWETELVRNPPWREQLMAESNRKPVGFIQIIDPAEEESHYWGDVAANLRAIDIWIGDEENLNKGFGTQMMTLALNRCFAESSVTKVLIDPLANNVDSHRFYKRFGFRFVEQRHFGQDDCFVFELHREDWVRWAKASGPDVILSLVIQPGSSQTEVIGPMGEPPRLKLKVAAPPVDGAANEELLRFLKKILREVLRGSPSQLKLLRGETSKKKDVLIEQSNLAPITAAILRHSKID